ncbi:MFS transporter [Curtobacterium sp. VKM Ac-2922]|uniref:MFS transporter n=1 Tax=Curtobacterium sp. VKM Ac-2922 TaxID=2929475 RepID=UPI001FB21C8B|nr:MFS transporter [Curtobacterium sp. VKM Ac-2922]MCJ1715719.1 MFS transporter [Curtobacterium sp. VKM Ac-2922]
MTAMFRSLSGRNYRIWFAGALVSNIGTWMQRTAQDWIVLTQLTHDNAIAVGITMALQFGPQLVLLPWTGLVADRFDRRRTLMVTQALMGMLGLGLGIMVVTDTATLLWLYTFALALGIVAAFDTPVRQAFVSDVVTGEHVSNAVALNSASFNAARLIGPAVAGVLIAAIGSGWVFIINAASFAAVLGALKFVDPEQLADRIRAKRGKGQILAGFRYVRTRPDIIVVLCMIFVVGTFGVNFPIFTSTMARVEFHKGAGEFGLLNSVMAIGSVLGALLSARRERPRMRLLVVASAGFGLACTAAAFAPTYWSFAIVLMFVGLASLTFMTTANALVQTTTKPAMRGRVMALYMAIFAGGTPIGAPIVGAIADAWGPRWAIGVGAASGFVALAIALVWLVRYQHFRLRYDADTRLHLAVTHSIPVISPRAARAALRQDLARDEAVSSRSSGV